MLRSEPQNDGEVKLPDIAIKFMKTRNVLRYKVICKDGRSWIVKAISIFKGEARCVIFRVFHNGYCRDWIALPSQFFDQIVEEATEYNKIVLDLNKEPEKLKAMEVGE